MSYNTVVWGQNDIQRGKLAGKRLQKALQFKYSISGLQKVLQILPQTARDNLHNGYKTIIFFFLSISIIFFSFP